MDRKKMLQIEPKLNNRFQVTFPQETGIDGRYVKSIDKPTYFPDRDLFWGDINIRFYDPIGPSIAQQIHNYIRKSNKQIDDFFENPLFKLTIETLGPVGDVVEKWEIDVALILSVDFGIFTYYDDDESSIKMKIRPAKCVLVF